MEELQSSLRSATDLDEDEARECAEKLFAGGYRYLRRLGSELFEYWTNGGGKEGEVLFE